MFLRLVLGEYRVVSSILARYAIKKKKCHCAIESKFSVFWSALFILVFRRHGRCFSRVLLMRTIIDQATSSVEHYKLAGAYGL